MIRPARSSAWRALTPRVAVAGLQLAVCALGGASAAATPAHSPHGVDLAGIDRSIAPGDDFFRYANGAWLTATGIPPDRSSYGPGEQLTELTAARTAELVRNTAGAPAGSEARKIGEYYASFMDEEGIEKKGLEPLQPALRSIDAVKDRAGLARATHGAGALGPRAIRRGTQGRQSLGPQGLRSARTGPRLGSVSRRRGPRAAGRVRGMAAERSHRTVRAQRESTA